MLSASFCAGLLNPIEIAKKLKLIIFSMLKILIFSLRKIFIFRVLNNTFSVAKEWSLLCMLKRIKHAKAEFSLTYRAQSYVLQKEA